MAKSFDWQSNKPGHVAIYYKLPSGEYGVSYKWFSSEKEHAIKIIENRKKALARLGVKEFSISVRILNERDNG